MKLMIFIYSVLVHHASHYIRCYHSYKQIDYYRYRSIHRKNYKKLMKINNLVEDHHIIPKQWKHHELLTKVDFEINNSKNIYIMPNKKCKRIFELDDDILIHQGGHHAYNMYVKENMDTINKLDTNDEIKYTFWLFFHHLKSSLYKNHNNIPWK